MPERREVQSGQRDKSLQEADHHTAGGQPVCIGAGDGYRRDNGWEFIICYKTGSIPSITLEYEKILEKGTERHAEFVNDIDYNGKLLNMLWL